jgi:hypothetical protein
MNNVQKKGKQLEQIEEFVSTTMQLKWDAAEVKTSLETLCLEAFELVTREIDYYVQARMRLKYWSGIFRILMLVFGAAGLIMPLLELTGITFFGIQKFGNFGYLFIAIAGVFVAANKLFGGTRGHIRYVTTQLHLEKMVATTSVSWNQQKCNWQDRQLSEEEFQAAFTLISKFLDQAYTEILHETELWGNALSQALDEYAKKIAKKTK